jgi:hypothetical protein
MKWINTNEEKPCVNNPVWAWGEEYTNLPFWGSWDGKQWIDLDFDEDSNFRIMDSPVTKQP